MGLLLEGQWTDQWYDTDASGGRFVRSSAQFRNWVTADGSPGPSGVGGFVAEPGRYLILCAIPTGADPAEYLAAAATSEGPPQVEGGQPHFMNGMYAEILVTG